MSRKNYKALNNLQHFLIRPTMWIDSVERQPRKAFVFDFQEKKCKLTTIHVPYGLERIFIELVSNACDNLNSSRRDGYCDNQFIQVEMDRHVISVTSGGFPIPIEMSEYGCYIPEFCFGRFLSGSNFEENREDGGAHGIGCKATNASSNFFEVYVQDHIRRLQYCQRWYNQMSVVEPPQITPYQGSVSTVRITYQVNFQFFGYDPAQGYPDEAFALYARNLLDGSFTSRAPVKFNGESYLYNSIKSYASLFFDVDSSTSLPVTFYQWPVGTSIVRNEDGTEQSMNNLLPEVEIIAVSAINKGTTIGLANSIFNQEGGVHVNAALTALTSRLLDAINNTSKGKDQAEKKPEDKTGPKVTKEDIRKNIGLIVSVRVNSPQWNGQCKTKLQGPRPTISIPADSPIFNQIKKWDLCSYLKNLLKMKLVRKMIAGNKNQKLTERNARLAGTKSSEQCVLIICEGKSALNYCTCYIGNMNNGRDWFGVCPLKGKPKNVYDCEIDNLTKNDELALICRMLGAEPDLDYTIDANRRKLRYGKVVFMTDADIDGRHIKGLLIVLFRYFYPSLFEAGIIIDYLTPVLKAVKSNESLLFYNEEMYRQWIVYLGEEEVKKWDIIYYKGLGSSEENDVAEHIRNPHWLTMIADQQADNYLKMMFDKNQPSARRDFYLGYKPELRPGPIINGYQDISHFVLTDMFDYTLANINRHLCSFDGLNETSRKIIFTALKYKWPASRGASRPTKFEKIAVFSPKVISKTMYKHGESIHDVVIRLARIFVGCGNNIPYLLKNGMFGSIDRGGKDAANYRYLSVQFNRWFAKSIFRDDDEIILKYQHCEGKQIEPYVYYPILPPCLINSMECIGTGWKSHIPTYHPLELAYHIMRRNQGVPMEQAGELIPWFRGFPGKIKLEKKTKTKGTKTNVNLFGSDMVIKNYVTTERHRIEIHGSYKITGGDIMSPYNVLVEYLPVGVWNFDYVKRLKEMKEKNIIQDYTDRSSDKSSSFVIQGYTNKSADGLHQMPSLEDLGLIRHQSLNNLYLIDEQSRPVRFETIEQLVDGFISWRLPFYQKRLDEQIRLKFIKIEELDQRARFIQAVLDGELVIVRGNRTARSAVEMEYDCDRLGLNKMLLDKVVPKEFSQERVLELLATKQKILDEIERLRNTRPEVLWNSEIEDFVRKYINEYGDDRPRR